MSKTKKIISVFLIFVVLLVGSLTVSAENLEKDNYIVYTKNLGSIFGDGDIAFYQNANDTGSFYDLPIINGNSGFLQNPFFYCAQKDSSKIASRVVCQPTWALDTSVFNGSKQYLFDFYIGVTKNGSNAFQNLKRFYFRFGNYNDKSYTPIEYIYGSGSSTLGYAHFRFVVDGQILVSSLKYCTFDFEDFNANYTISFGLPKEEPYTTFTIKEYTEAEQVLDEEEDRANKGGNDSVNELGSVIPNDSGGFIDSLSNFVGAMAYDGTECNWQFPSLYLPAIQGVMPKINLTDELEIPFEYWISKIPSGILTLVRSLLTIALIVFCFKELYNIISYVLTLRGGGNSE